MTVSVQTEQLGEGRRRPTALIWGAVTLILAVLGAGAWALIQEPPGPSLRLAGGGVLHLKGIDYGRRYVLREQRLWQQLFGPFLPEVLRGREVIRGSWARERLTLWFRPERDPQPWHFNRRLEAVDEHGCRYDGGLELGMRLHERVPYRKGGLLLFPRRSDSFRVRLVEDGPEAADELTVTNPVPGPHPTWQPEPLPAARRVGRLEVRLLSLTAGLTRERLLRQPGDAVQDDGDALFPRAWRTKSWARAAFQILEGGRTSDHWRIAHLTVSDATGNGATYPDHEQTSFMIPAGTGQGRIGLTATGSSGGCIRGTTPVRGERWIAFPGLCVRESAWKLRALLAYAGPPEGQPADLSWTVPGVPAVRPFKQTSAIAVQGFPGVRLKLMAVAGRGAWGAEELDDPAAGVRVFVTATPGDGITLAVTGTDERDRPVACHRSGSTDMGPYHRWWFDLRVPEGARRMSLRFTGTRGRPVEFLVRPTPGTATGTVQ